MKGFKNTTRTQYSMGGDVYAKGGMAKGAAKISKVMGEFKKGELHSGSKEGPKVTKPAQAKAIAMSEARKAGMKAPMKKNGGGKVGKMPPLGESVKSGNRMSKMTAAERLAMEARFGEKKRPSPADSAKSANRISAQEAAEARAMGVFKEGGKVRKYAEGGAVTPFNPTQALNAFSADLARRVQAGTMTKQQAQQAQSQFRNQVQLNTKAPPTRQGAEGIARDIMKSVMAPPASNPFAGLTPAQKRATLGDINQAPAPPAQPPMGRPEMPADFGHLPPGVPGFEQQYAQPPMKTPGLGSIGSGLRDLAVKQPPMSAGVGGMPPMMQPPMIRDMAYIEGRDYTIDPRTGQRVPVRNSDPFGGSFGKLQPPMQVQPPMQTYTPPEKTTRPDPNVIQPTIVTANGRIPNPAYTADVAMQRYSTQLPTNNYYSPQERQQIMSSIENAYAQPGATGQQVNKAYQNASAAATRARPTVGAPSTQPSMPTTPMVQPPAIDRFATATPVAPPPPMPGFRMGGMAKRRPC